MKGQKTSNVQRSSPRERNTSGSTVSADGRCISPYVIHEGHSLKHQLVEKTYHGGAWSHVTGTPRLQGPTVLEPIKMPNHSHSEYQLKDDMPISHVSWPSKGTDCTSPSRHRRCAEVSSGEQDGPPLPATVTLLVRDSTAGCPCLRCPEGLPRQRHPKKGSRPARRSSPGRCPSTSTLSSSCVMSRRNHLRLPP